MSGRGEDPEDEGEQPSPFAISPGEEVYNDEGTVLGVIRGIEEGGFFVTTREGAEKLSIEHARSGQGWGEAELMWRCVECGEMGEIDEGIPDHCPNCGAEKENIMYWTED